MLRRGFLKAAAAAFCIGLADPIDLFQRILVKPAPYVAEHYFVAEFDVMDRATGEKVTTFPMLVDKDEVKEEVAAFVNALPPTDWQAWRWWPPGEKILRREA